MVIRHEQQHNETMLQTLKLAAAGRVHAARAPLPDRPPFYAAGRKTLVAGGPFELGAPRRRVRLRQRAARAHVVDLARVRDRRHAGHERRVPRLRRGRRLRAARALVRGGLGVARARGHRAAAVLDRRRARALVRHGRGDRPRRAGDARLLVRGRRLRALARRAAADRGRVGEGGQLVAGQRAHPALPVGRRGAAPEHANLDQLAFRARVAGRVPGGQLRPRRASR